MPTNEKISQSELGRRLNMPAPKLNKAVLRGLITPDEIIFGRTRLFRVDRLEAIRTALGAQARLEVVA